MTSVSEILSILADGKFHSGEQLGKNLDISRSAVWKKIKSLSRYGLAVHSVKGKGYRLSKSIEFLHRNKIFTSIDAEIKPWLNKLTILDITDSTNQYLLNIIDKREFHAHCVFAEFQTAGRGRRGHGWISPYASGINFSTGWYFETPPDYLTSISLGAGVAIIRTLNRLNINTAGLKWPNDIFWDNRKLGGSLVELRAEPAGPCKVVVGIGINYSFPEYNLDSIDQPWVDMATIQKDLTSRNLFAAVLITELLKVMVQIQNDGVDNIIKEWRKYDAMKGKQATLLLTGTSISGNLLGIDDTGALLMSVNDSVKKFNSGEISLRVKN